MKFSERFTTDLDHGRHHGGRDIIKYIGPGLLVTVGFIDPGNWASNIAAGSQFGYALLWMVTLSTFMLIGLQHNAAHLGIASGLCLAEAIEKYFPRWLAKPILVTALLACGATALAEVLGGAIALQMLFHIPLKIGAVLVAALSIFLLLGNSYRKVEKWIIGFVSLIGISFLIEVVMVPVDWEQTAISWVTPQMPENSMPIIMSVLGAVVMPHNLFLHSEVIQSRKLNEQGHAAIEKHLKYEFVDTLLSMSIGWAINSAMIILAAATFFSVGMQVDDLALAAQTLTPIAGPAASLLFAVALLFAGVASSITAGMAAGTVSAGMAGEPFDIRDKHSVWGVIGVFVGAALVIMFIEDAFAGLVWSQVFLSMQLPITIFSLIWLTSSGRVMGRYKNSLPLNISLWAVGIIVTALNIALLLSM